MTSPNTGPSRPSRFVEGEPLNDVLPTTTDTLFAFLSEHDLHESRRSRQNSQSSNRSTSTSTSARLQINYLPPDATTSDAATSPPLRSKRSFAANVHDFDLLKGTGRVVKERLRNSLEEVRSARQAQTQKETMTAAGEKIVGRLRALTTGQTHSRGGLHFEKKSRYGKVVVYPGT